MADKEVIHTSEGGSGIGILGVIVGAALVVGAIFFFAGGNNWFGKGGSGGPNVTINAPSMPKAPTTTGSR